MSGVQHALCVPVLVECPHSAHPQAVWPIWAPQHHTVKVHCANDGSRHFELNLFPTTTTTPVLFQLLRQQLATVRVRTRPPRTFYSVLARPSTPHSPRAETKLCCHGPPLPLFAFFLIVATILQTSVQGGTVAFASFPANPHSEPQLFHSDPASPTPTSHTCIVLAPTSSQATPAPSSNPAFVPNPTTEPNRGVSSLPYPPLPRISIPPRRCLSRHSRRRLVFPGNRCRQSLPLHCRLFQIAKMVDTEANVPTWKFTQ
jgi:hypothetical protein